MIHNPDTLVAISAYAGDRIQVENNMPYYAHHGCQVVLFTPEDAPIENGIHPGVVYFITGKKGWTGPQTLERQRKFLAALLKFPQNYFLFNDSDSVCLSPRLPDYLYATPDVIWSNEVLDTNPAPSHLPKLALQPPYFFSRKAVEGLLKAVDNLPVSYYQGVAGFEGLPVPTECIDHYMLQLACGSGYVHHNFFTGASFETESAHGEETMVDLVRNHGRVLVHSIKRKPVLDRLAQAHAEYVKRHT